ncbi:MAG TPA: hypothetical protein VH164_01155 [Ktedonobacteraceae bacterium]|jgi:hypothetical protein|nr:hypothetical protein [Ktedonobacteraceae bacterium]
MVNKKTWLDVAMYEVFAEKPPTGINQLIQEFYGRAGMMASGYHTLTIRDGCLRITGWRGNDE